MKNSNSILNPYKINWYIVIRFQAKKNQTVRLPKYLIKGTGVSTSYNNDVIFTHSKEDAKKIFNNCQKHGTKRCLSFIITDKQFGLINSKKAEKIFNVVTTSFGKIPVTKKQMSADWLNPHTNLL
ncbi:MAG: hypothetical protein PHX51_07050 [Clostridia bacterium]|nr:hypothetical protein [Clostridia bacterium]